ncbi:hypothetical protein F5Y17DRAFT_470784 [Xylariaceae sp. FL0594]|nr:hypothetical protein F5Y17DRAFT_470784 [Xylariaceae sp. FL0594]
MQPPLPMLKPSTFKCGEEILLPPEERILSYDYVYPPSQLPVTSSFFSSWPDEHKMLEMQQKEMHQELHQEEAPVLPHFPDPNAIIAHGNLRHLLSSTELGLRQLELCLSGYVVECGRLRTMHGHGHGYFSEMNREHSGLLSLKRDTTCGDVTHAAYCTSGGGGRQFSVGVSIEHLFRLSRHFSSAINSILSLGSDICHEDLMQISMVYSKLESMHDTIVQLTARSIQLSKDATVDALNYHSVVF